MIIYLITNAVNGRQYVGQTIQKLNKRFAEHKRFNNNRGILSKAISKYGKENFYFDQIDTAKTQSELNMKECYWIEKLNTLSPNGYNLRQGGSHGKMSEKAIENIVNGHLNIKTSRASSKYYGVSPHRKNTGFRAKITVNRKIFIICESKSEEYCAYKYNEYIANNNINRIPNIFSKEEIEKIKLYISLMKKSKLSTYIGVSIKTKNNRKYYSSSIRINRKYITIGSFKSEIEAAKAYNKYLLDNNINRPLNLFEDNLMPHL